jgi:geranylgeranyl pyrophosphate synthase
LSSLNSILTPVQKDLAIVESIMHASVKSQNEDLANALDQIITSGGKRIRPAISLLISKVLGGPKEKIYFLAASVEILHSATLVHDDLIDGALIRRGIQTLNAKWSAGATVLSGDYLFSCSAKLAADTESTRVVKRFSETLSIIVNGEITQLFHGPCRLDRDEYYQRIYAKTASLFETCAYCSALLCSDDSQVHEAFKTYGREIGMAFQIVDDILDFTGDQATLGKPVGNDLNQGLFTLPIQIYTERYPNRKFVQDIVSGNCIEDNENIKELISDLVSTDAIRESLNVAKEFSERGIRSIEGYPTSEEHTSLIDLANFIVDRDL